MGRDFRDWKQWIAEGKTIEQISKVDEEFNRGIDLKQVDKGSGRYNAIICQLALNGPEDFFEASILGTVDFTDQKINDHHIFPKKVDGIEPEYIQTFESSKDSIANRTLILDSTNNKIKNKRPSNYIGQMIDDYGDEHEVRSIFKNHFVSSEAYRYLKEDDFDNFIIAREKEIKKQIIQNMGL